ncbi:hypothetical protein B0H17DRAFT_1148549 [Mycena rosella]|uniref:Uncharacterized protein n=1 Tax=Mycena rosella TaxID=1033263 RepID=A0AAD7C9U2_MYCRO|nr:hypothetical protein B0H17DRAFT_1148549 [Mycena rosella]
MYGNIRGAYHTGPDDGPSRLSHDNVLLLLRPGSAAPRGIEVVVHSRWGQIRDRRLLSFSHHSADRAPTRTLACRALRDAPFPPFVAAAAANRTVLAVHSPLTRQNQTKSAPSSRSRGVFFVARPFSADMHGVMGHGGRRGETAARSPTDPFRDENGAWRGDRGCAYESPPNRWMHGGGAASASRDTRAASVPLSFAHRARPAGAGTPFASARRGGGHEGEDEAQLQMFRCAWPDGDGVERLSLERASLRAAFNRAAYTQQERKQSRIATAYYETVDPVELL